MINSAVIDLSQQRTYGSRLIQASAQTIFDLLADPAAHPSFDGSGMVRDNISGPARLTMGAKFGMNMKFGPVPYRISSKVVEYDENALIAWQHFGKHRWRYELEETEGGTLVTETFDWSTALIPAAIEKVGYPERHKASIDQTLERLAARVEHNA